VPNRDVQLHLGCQLARIVRHSSHNDDGEVARTNRPWLGSDTTLNCTGVQLGNAHTDTVALFDSFDWLAEHLHRLDLFVLLESRQLNNIADFGFACQDGSSNDCPLTLD
jgi:hypothetical protein